MWKTGFKLSFWTGRPWIIWGKRWSGTDRSWPFPQPCRVWSGPPSAEEALLPLCADAITFSEGSQAIPQKEGRIVLKLFNLLVPELGPRLLAKGIWLMGEDLNRFLGGLKKDFWDECREAVKNGQKIIIPSDVSDHPFTNDDLVLLKVTSLN